MGSQQKNMSRQNYSLNAIRQSNEYIYIGKNEMAMEILWDAIHVRRGRCWNLQLEEAMNNFLKLCISLKSSHSFKEGANQYKMLCQLTNVNSFETLMNNFFTNCIEIAEKCKSESREKILAEDLDEIETPETIILKSISETTQKDRTDRTMLSPILKFTWESFRNILEICKNNKNLEKIYCELAKKTFKFLLQFERKTEFRKLCDVTRMHLSQTIKYTQNTLALNLNEAASSIDLQLEVRLSQLDTALSMELWNEAFKTMEDIHLLLRLFKKVPHPKILAIFYQKISIVFAKTNYTLFHAIALQKLFILIKEHKKGFKPEEMVKISSRVVAASLSVPLTYNHHLHDNILYRSDQYHTSSQLSNILGLSEIPTRESLLNDLVQLNIITYADPSIINIFHLLMDHTKRFHLCQLLSQQLIQLPTYLIDELSTYSEPIKKVAFLLQLKSFSQFYQSLPIHHIQQFSTFYSDQQVIDLILESSRTKFIQLTIDGVQDIVHFSPQFYHPQTSTITSYHSYTNLPIALLQQVSSIYQDTCATDKSETLFQSYYFNGNEELERYESIKKHIEIYLEEISRENEQQDKIMVEKIEQEAERMDKMASELLEEERRIRVENRQIQMYQQNQLQTISKDLADSVPIDQKHTKTAATISTQNDIIDKKVAVHVKRMKKIEKYLDVISLLIKNTTSQHLPTYLRNQFQYRLESWDNCESERIAAIQKEKSDFYETKQRLLSCSDDIDSFLSECKITADEIHQNSLKQYNEMVQLEREQLILRNKPEYISRKKSERVKQMKLQYEKEKYFKPTHSTTTGLVNTNKINQTTQSTTPTTNKFRPVKKRNIKVFDDTAKK